MCLRDPRKAFEAKLLELGKDNEAIVAISCDSASGGGLGAFFQAYPNRSVEVGISEQTAVGISAAMARQGFIPVVVAIDPFLTMRAYEQIRDDVGYMHTNVKLVASGGGLAYSTLGSTHMALEDVALMRTVPNLVVLCPGDADEVEFCLEEAIKIDGPVFIRMPRQAKEPPAKRTQRKLELGRGGGTGGRRCSRGTLYLWAQHGRGCRGGRDPAGAGGIDVGNQFHHLKAAGRRIDPTLRVLRQKGFCLGGARTQRRAGLGGGRCAGAERNIRAAEGLLRTGGGEADRAV